MLQRLTLISPIVLVALSFLAGCATNDAPTSSAPSSVRGPTDGQGTDAGTPAPPRDVPAGYADALTDAIAEIDGRTGLGPDLKVDTTKLKTHVLDVLQTGGKDADAGFFLGVQAITDAYPIGHLAIYPADMTKCGTANLPAPSTSVVDACTQPYADHAVVTAVRPTNDLGLVAGDEILAIDDKSGQAMLDATLARPMCAGGVPSASVKRTRAGTSVFAGVTVGTKVTIKHIDGTTETKTIRKISAYTDCHDPFSRGASPKGTIRPDGAGVLRIPSFYEAAGGDPSDPNDKLTNAIKAEFDKVKSAPYLLIDVRGNGGGSTMIGLAIAAGMPGAQSMDLAQCAARVPHSTSYSQNFTYSVAPSDQFAYTGKVAVLVDGNAFSATDYFTRTMRLATSAIIVGRPNAGAYGGTTDNVKIDKGPGLVIYPDPWRCTDMDGKTLEGQTVKLDAEQDLAPADLAAGKDTDAEAALAILKK